MDKNQSGQYRGGGSRGARDTCGFEGRGRGSGRGARQRGRDNAYQSGARNNSRGSYIRPSETYRGGHGQGNRRGNNLHDSGVSFRGRGSYAGTSLLNRIEPQDPACGTNGKKIIVETNYLPIKVNDNTKLKCFHYIVKIEPERKKLLGKILETLRDKYFKTINLPFDGKENVFSPKNIEYHGEVSITFGDNSKAINFMVSLVLKNEIDLSIINNYSGVGNTKDIQNVLQALSVILRASPLARCIVLGSRFFKPPTEERIISLSNGIELLTGFHQAPSLGQRGPFVNIDVVHRAFLKKMSLIEWMQEILNLPNIPDSLNNQQLYQLKVLEGARIEYNMGNKIIDYSINGFRGTAEDEKIPVENNCSVRNYFQVKRQYKIKYPHLPLVWVGNKNKETPILLPVECCSLKRGQTNQMLTNDVEIVRKMIAKTVVKPDERKRKIQDQIDIADYRNSPYLKEFGISIDENFALVNARVLDSPCLLYKESKVSPKNGRWDLNGCKFLKSCTIHKWIVLNLDRRITSQKIVQLQDKIMERAEVMGIAIHSPENFKRIGISNIQKVFSEYRNQIDLFIVLLDDQSQYSVVKQEGDKNIGCLTQCIKTRTFNRDNNIPRAVIDNILLKINAKSGGINHTFVKRPLFLHGNIMVMGADVTHPGYANDKPSFAAVTTLLDRQFFKYISHMQAQSAKKEIIVDFRSIVAKSIKAHSKENNALPDHIIYFRDGVSEGQFDDLLKHELSNIHQACMNIKLKSETYKPKITFVVVMKRHHTRFFVTDGTNNNVPPGTCVDTGITHPKSMKLKDFYLTSHKSIRGVAKPTKYCTIYDDANLSYDDIEELANSLCYTYSRCTSAVSYPTPTYYAHLAAERAKILMSDKIDMMKNNEDDWKIDIDVKINEKKPMFFV